MQEKRTRHKSTSEVPKYVPKFFLVTFKIKNLALSDCVKDRRKVAPGRIRVGDAQFDR
jgi:hypothetical protein